MSYWHRLWYMPRGRLVQRAAKIFMTWNADWPNDLFIAAHARSLGLTLVTNDTHEFGCVPHLILENWTVSI